MRIRSRSACLVIATAAMGSALQFSWIPISSHAQDFRPRRTVDGAPDLNGIWQALNSANWDLQAHPARPGPVVTLGAVGAVPAGMGVVEGNEIPYLPAAAAQK